MFTALKWTVNFNILNKLTKHTDSMADIVGILVQLD